MAGSAHNLTRVRIAGAATQARKLAVRLSRAGIAAALDDGASPAEVIIALEAQGLERLRSRAGRLIVVAPSSAAALQAGADDVVAPSEPVLLFRRVRTVVEHRDLEQRARRLEQRLRILEEALAEAAHDLRSPLHAAIGHAELLAGDAGLDESRRRSAEAAARQANRALQLAERILAAAHRPGERIVPRIQPCDLTGLVVSAVASAEAQARQHDVKLSLVLPQRAVELRSDSELLARMLDNLIANAIRASPQGGHVEVAAWRAGPRTVRISVKDEGAGIEEKELGKLVAGLGPGRGLRICREIIDRHSGDLWAESLPGRGSRFVVELPLVFDTTRPQILLVSDDGKWARQLAQALREECDVRRVGTARARLSRRTDLVLVEAAPKGKTRNLLALRNAAMGAQVPVIELPSDVVASRLARALSQLTA